MAEERRAEILKHLIEDGKLKSFDEMFLYIHKTDVSAAIGVNYTRFLKLIKDPKKFRYEETMRIAHFLKVDPRLISELVHSQVEDKKKKG